MNTRVFGHRFFQLMTLSCSSVTTAACHRNLVVYSERHRSLLNCGYCDAALEVNAGSAEETGGAEFDRGETAASV